MTTTGSVADLSTSHDGLDVLRKIDGSQVISVRHRCRLWAARGRDPGEAHRPGAVEATSPAS